MKIAYITDQLYLHGGAERVLTNKVNYLANLEDMTIFIITNEQKKNKFCYDIDSKVKHLDINLIYKRDRSYFSILNIVKAPIHFYKLKSLLNKIKPDVIITLSSQYDYYFLPFIVNKTLIIKEFHSSRHYYQQDRANCSKLKGFVYKLNDFVERKYTYNVLLTDDEKKYFKSNNTIVIPNFLIDIPKSFSSLTNKKAISAGRIAPVKGFENLIIAWKIVFEKNKEWIIEVYGNGEKKYVEKLNNLIISLGLDNNFFIKEATHQIEQKMQEASFYVMSSLTECFPMVLLESMSNGLPIISFNCPNGPKNIVSHNNDGLLIEDGNVEKLALAILNMIENEEMRKNFSKNGTLNVKRYNKQTIMKKWLHLFGYKNLIL
ncbi:glycosyltransferase [Tamlana fucoidanivorans]|uniref:Glycosyltransferase family 4 protein n=1 Tax=Allotamlana fucoidanivorans TaxID=2583814 RepID=A0A5C4SSD4_9FLAO|nr:glycosyltransferase [Tamlana fucoidanivorans]TNJ46463.1 glycosyltransferase family 4 protein [Tamlana fucoidanivorans]